ncbi:hypothetical protein ACQ4PT_040329 [Festuca glaucescens]
MISRPNDRFLSVSCRSWSNTDSLSSSLAQSNTEQGTSLQRPTNFSATVGLHARLHLANNGIGPRLTRTAHRTGGHQHDDARHRVELVAAAVRRAWLPWLFAFAGGTQGHGSDKNVDGNGFIRDAIIEQCAQSRRCGLLRHGTRGQRNDCYAPGNVMWLFKSAAFCLQPQGNSIRGVQPEQIVSTPELHLALLTWNAAADIASCARIVAAGDVAVGGRARAAGVQVRGDRRPVVGAVGVVGQRHGPVPRVAGLAVAGKNLTGYLPSELGSLAFLRRLNLHGNRLSGTFQPALANATALRSIFLYDNNLTGAFPASLCDLPCLQNLDLSKNALTGALPAGLARCMQLVRLLLSSNDFTVAIPAGALPKMVSLQLLDLSSNSLTGAIPLELGRLPTLAGTLNISRTCAVGEHVHFAGPRSIPILIHGLDRLQ